MIYLENMEEPHMILTKKFSLDDTPDPDPATPPPSPYAGFYANLVGLTTSTKIVFLVEFSILLLMGLVMYGFYVHERRMRSKIKFTKTGTMQPSQGDSSSRRVNSHVPGDETLLK